MPSKYSRSASIVPTTHSEGAPQPGNAPSLPAQPVEISLLSLANLALRSRRLVVALVAVAATLTIVTVLLTDRTYTSTAAFMPQGRRQAPSFSGLAAQLGIGLGMAEAGQSPQFYVDLIRSREILLGVMDTTYPWGPSRTPTPLPAILKMEGDSPIEVRENTIKALRAMIEPSANLRTGVIRISLRSPDPELSQRLAARLIESTNRFNLRTRQSQGAAERRFTEGRLAEVRDSVRAAEDRLQNFLLANRDYRNSPTLVFQHERLTNELALIRAVHTTISQAYEQAKIEEVRDTPVITTIEQPAVALRPDTRGGMRKLILAMFLAAVLGVILTGLRTGLVHASTAGGSEYQQFDALRQATFNDLRHPLRAIRESVALAGRGNGRSKAV
jgi:uncharacterized protein involved in exopolysaccharide biosynthesis